MRIFVTGASGFVGGAATAHLKAKGHDVRAMSRSEKSDAKIRALGGEPVRCDLEDVRGEHLSGCDAVIHSAAFVEQWGPRDAWFNFNVEGTRAVLNAAKQAGVKRFIHIGTEAALFHGQHLRGVDETYPLAPNSPYPYSATKAQAEQLVRDANAQGFETIALRPRFIWGPGDTTLLPLIAAMAKSGQWAWVGGGANQTSTTHIANLTHAIELALTRGTPGEAYFILDDGVRTMKEMITQMAATQRVTLPDRSLPVWVADMAGAWVEFLWRTFNVKRAPPLTRFSAMIMSRDAVLSDAKARRELGYAPVISVDDGMSQLARL